MPSVDGPSLTTAPTFSTKMSSIQVGRKYHSSADFVFCSDPADNINCGYGRSDLPAQAGWPTGRGPGMAHMLQKWLESNSYNNLNLT